MEEENGYLLNFDQEDDNLLGISSGELGSGVNPLLPTITPCKLKPSSAEFVANHPGKLTDARDTCMLSYCCQKVLVC